MANSIALNAVYDHVLTNYKSKDVTQTETHKKSELRGIYNSIVKINKDSPLFLLKDDTQDEAQAVGLKEEARALRSTIYGLSNLDENILDQKSAYSSNEDAVEANFVKNAAEEEELPSFRLNVRNLAQSQVNTGRFLPSGAVQLEPGQYSFNVRVGEQKYEFQYTINKGDFNREVQDRLSRLVDKAGVGLRASVINDGNGYTALEITASDTGTVSGRDYRFKITEDEISTNGGTLAYFGLDQVSTQAENAVFEINGKERVSASNHFMVGGVYELTLRGTTNGEEIEIGVRNDTESLIEHVKQLAKGYNDFLDGIVTHDSESFKRSKIESETRAIAEEHLGKLADEGIHVTDSGKIEIDEARLAEVSRDEEGIDRFLPVNDFAKSLIEKSREISLDPMKYIDRPVVNYKNPGHGFVAPYVTSEYSGMLFSGYC